MGIAAPVPAERALRSACLMGSRSHVDELFRSGAPTPDANSERRRISSARCVRYAPRSSSASYDTSWRIAPSPRHLCKFVAESINLRRTRIPPNPPPPSFSPTGTDMRARGCPSWAATEEGCTRPMSLTYLLVVYLARPISVQFRTPCAKRASRGALQYRKEGKLQSVEL